jgi:hypothetical protein
MAEPTPETFVKILSQSDDDLLDQNDEVFNEDHTDDQAGKHTVRPGPLGQKNPNPRGRPPLGPVVARLQMDLQYAQATNDRNRKTIEELQTQLEEQALQQPPDINHDQITALTEENKNQLDVINTCNAEIMNLTENTLKQGKRIAILLAQNQRLKATNENLIDRIAIQELNSKQQAQTNEKKPHIIILGDSNARRMEHTLKSDNRFTITLHQSGTMSKALDQIRNKIYPPQWQETKMVLNFLGTNDLQNGSKAGDIHSMTSELARAIDSTGRKEILSQIPPSETI